MKISGYGPVISFSIKYFASLLCWVNLMLQLALNFENIARFCALKLLPTMVLPIRYYFC